MFNTPIEEIITTKRARTVLKNYGYKSYNDIRTLTLEDLKSMEGMGSVTSMNAWSEIELFKRSLYDEVIRKTIDLADIIGVEKVLKVLEEAKSEI